MATTVLSANEILSFHFCDSLLLQQDKQRLVSSNKQIAQDLEKDLQAETRLWTYFESIAGNWNKQGNQPASTL